MFKKLFEINGNYNWIDFYNNSFHKGINGIPYKIFYNEEEKIPEQKNTFKKLKIGDKVRLLEQSETFNKKHLTKWSKKVYIVSSQIGVGYELMNSNGEKLNRKYFDKELLKIDSNTKSNIKNNANIQRDNLISNRIERVKRNLN